MACIDVHKNLPHKHHINILCKGEKSNVEGTRKRLFKLFCNLTSRQWFQCISEVCSYKELLLYTSLSCNGVDKQKSIHFFNLDKLLFSVSVLICCCPVKDQDQYGI